MNCKNCGYGLKQSCGDFEKIICTYEEGECVKIEELEAQIEKMKCCSNCKHYQYLNDAGYYTCIKDGKRNGRTYRSCKFNFEKWEFEEIKEK